MKHKRHSMGRNLWMTAIEIEVLLRLSSGQPVKRIRNGVGLSKTAIYNWIRELEGKGLLEKSGSAWGLTDRGWGVLACGLPTRAGLMSTKDGPVRVIAIDKHRS